MQIAALYDIHSNLPALKAVLQELEDLRPDVIVIGGDIVPGPMPDQTLECLRQFPGNVVALRGNGDREIVTAYDGHLTALNLPEDIRAITSWNAERLNQDQRDFLANLPEYLTLPLPPFGDVLFCHATPHSDTEIFTPLTPLQRLEQLFQGVEQKAVICGHTHMQFELRVGDIHILNAGSVGMPYADRPGAYWIMLGTEGHELRATFHRTDYDLEGAAQAIRTSGYPQAQEFATENVLTVPTAKEAMEIFERRTAS